MYPLSFRLPENAHLTISVSAYKPPLGLHEELRRHTQRSMRERMAETMLAAKLEERELEHSVEFRLDVIVLNPDEFARIVHDEAHRLALAYMPMTMRDKSNV